MTILQIPSQGLPILLVYVVLFGLVYFLMIYRPQQTQARRRREMLSKLKKGDRIVTLGGLHATIHDVNGDHLTLELTPNVRVKADRSAVNYVRGRKDKESGPPTTA